MEINEQQFREAEVLLELSCSGIHLLFPNLQEILPILRDPIPVTASDLNIAETAFAQLLKKPSVHMKREYLAGLSGSSYRSFIRAYFHVVEAQILHAQRLKH